MNHCVPSFDIDEDYPTPSVSRARKATLEDDGIMELLWQNGQVVVQSQKLVKKSAASDFNGDDLNNSGRREIHHQSQPQQNLFMQEDEMASWLHYPLNDAAFDNDFCSDLLYSPAPSVNATAIEAEAPAATTTTTTASTATPTASAHRAAQLAEQSKAKMSLRPPIPPSRIVDSISNWTSRGKARVAESVPSGSNRAANEFTVVDSNETPTVPPQSRVSEPAHLEMPASGTIGRAASLAASSSGTGTDAAACEMMLMPSSPGTSSASPELRPPPVAPPEDRKRKGRELDDADCYSEDIELESPDAKKHARGSTSAKRSRAAEVHNLSERRRRDRINEKMRALQELVPHCNKADKASMLDEAIEYLKSLQMQVQMMSMGCSMVPMMFPGVQQYMPPHPHMAAAMGMGAMGGMGMNRPMMPFSNIMPGGSLSTAGAHMGMRFPMPTPFHQQQQQQHFGGAEPSRIIPPNSHSANPMMGSSYVMQNPNHPPNFVDPYQQYLSSHHMQFQPQQQQQQQQLLQVIPINQAVHQGSSKSGTSKGA